MFCNLEILICLMIFVNNFDASVSFVKLYVAINTILFEQKPYNKDCLIPVFLKQSCTYSRNAVTLWCPDQFIFETITRVFLELLRNNYQLDPEVPPPDEGACPDKVPPPDEGASPRRGSLPQTRVLPPGGCFQRRGCFPRQGASPRRGCFTQTVPPPDEGAFPQTGKRNKI